MPVWRRNLLVWRKLAIASVLGNIADPLLYMLALGYGIGSLVGEVGGMSYIAFIGTGMVCQSAMFTSSFEGMYSAFSRMHVQRTWEAIINAPIALDDVVFAEWIWCGDEGRDVDGGDPARHPGARLRPHVARAVDPAARASSSACASARSGS